MKHLLLTSLLITASCCLSTAHAQDAYIGADAVFGHYSFKLPGVASADDSANTVSGRLLAGYNFDQTWAIEGGYAWFGSAKYNFSANNAYGSVNASAHAFYGAAKASVHLDDKFSLYAKLGIAHDEVNRDGSGSGAALTRHINEESLYAGVGAQYKLTDKAALTLELEHYGPLDSVGGSTVVVSTGVRYSF